MPLDAALRDALHDGLVIPAHPLALTERRALDERRQRALTRYYLAAGAGGVAVGVHTTQFEIRDPRVGLLEPVLTLAAEELARAPRPIVKIAGVCGPTAQAVREAELAASLGYDLVLLSAGGLNDYTNDALLDRARQVGDVLPIIGFYLQPSVGGRDFDHEFWRAFMEIPTVEAVKVAPFDRYKTLDVIRAVCESSRAERIALYTGNDDNIIADLLTTYRFKVNGRHVEKRFVGGLLGHWAVWTRTATELLKRVKRARSGEGTAELLTLGVHITDANAAFFDPGHAFAGCIPGLHEVLRRQGLLEGRWCLNPHEELSDGQLQEINRVYAAYPELNDDAFVGEHLHEWLS